MKSTGAKIAYELVRSRRKTADIVIERDGRVLVRAPEEVTHERIEDIIESKRYWIYRNLAEWRDLNATRVVREYRNGEGFLYLGRSYRLLLVAGQEQPLLLKGGRFCLRRDLVDRGEIPAAQAAFRDYYVARGAERLTQRVWYYAPKVGVVRPRIAVRDLGHRWASCSPSGNIAFHWKCMMAPAMIIDYIVVHELCHFHHLDHTDAFWNEVDKVMPGLPRAQGMAKEERRGDGCLILMVIVTLPLLSRSTRDEILLAPNEVWSAWTGGPYPISLGDRPCQGENLRSSHGLLGRQPFVSAPRATTAMELPPDAEQLSSPCRLGTQS